MSKQNLLCVKGHCGWRHVLMASDKPAAHEHPYRYNPALRYIQRVSHSSHLCSSPQPSVFQGLRNIYQPSCMNECDNFFKMCLHCSRGGRTGWLLYPAGVFLGGVYVYVPSTAEIEIYKVYLYFEPSLHLHSFERLKVRVSCL